MGRQFLYHDSAERERLLDLSVRLRPAYSVTVAFMAIPAICGGFVYGWLSIVPILAGMIAFVVLTRGLPRRRRPELFLFTSCVLGIAATLASIWLAHGPKEYLFALPVFPLLGMAPIFSRRVSVTAAVASCVGIVLVALGSYGPEVRAMPPFVIIPITLVLVTVFGAMASRKAEELNRGTAVVDPLTGLLNRAALQGRATELALHAERTGTRVGLMIVDLDHFKAINDTFGHASGDEVLAEVAARLRSELDADAMLFRFGGEEFLILLPDTTPGVAAAWAERLRAAIVGAPIAGRAVTASFGVAITDPGQGFDYQSLFVRADGALYRAKQSGRNRVCSSREPTVVIAAGAHPASPSGLDELATSAANSVTTATKARNRKATARSSSRDSEGNWLVADAIERANVVDLLERSRRDSQIGSAISFIGLASCGFWLGWWLLLPPIIAGIVWDLITARMPRARRPEFAGIGGLMLIVISAGLATMLADPQALYALPMTSLSLIGAAAGVKKLGGLLLGVTAFATVIVCGLLVDAGAIVANPLILTYPLALAAANVLLGSTFGSSVRQHRVAGVTDHLTGVFNRAALETRIPELAQRSATSGAPISLLVFDIDHFKQVNDEHGHETGDVVLAEVADRLRASLGAFDSVYRIGGEEFVVVLPDTPVSRAASVADAARLCVAATPIHGLPVTVSAGVATGGVGTRFNYDTTFAVADRCLYAAKRSGRNKVLGGPSLEIVADPERAAA